MNKYRIVLNPDTGRLQLVLSDSHVISTATTVVFKEGVATVGDLPIEGNTKNDARIVNDTHHLYIWDGSAWQDQGDIIDIGWASIEGKPVSEVVDIDTAVVKRHDKTHSIIDPNSHSDKVDYIDSPNSPTILTGGLLSEGTNPGTFKVGSLTALIRKTASDIGELTKITLGEQDNQAVSLVDTSYFVCLDYNEGVPQVITSLTQPNGQTVISIGNILKDTLNIVHYLQNGARLTSGTHKLHVRAFELRAQEIAKGIVLADEGNKKISISEGVIYVGIDRINWAVFNSAEVDNVFTYLYYDGDLNGGTWVYLEDQTDIDVDNYNDVATGLSTCNKYKCDWVFVHPDMTHVYVVYGQTNDKKAKVQCCPIPNLPDVVDTFGILVGRIIIEGGEPVFDEIQPVENCVFNPNSVISHNESSNIQGGDESGRFHLTQAQHGAIGYAMAYVEDETVSTTIETAWQQKLRMNFTPLFIGDYLLEWSLEISNDKITSSTFVQIELDDITQINHVVKKPGIVNGYANCSGFKKLNFADTNLHTIDVDFKTESDTAMIRKVRVTMRKI